MQLNGQDPHPHITKTLAGLLDLIRDLDNDIPADLSNEERLAWKSAQLGTLLAGVWATCQRSSIGARALVRTVQWNCNRNPEIAVLLDRFRSVSPPNHPFDVDLNLNDVKRGAATAEAAIVALPDAPLDDGDPAAKKAYATWIGAIAGVFEGLVERGFDPVVFDSLEVARKTIMTLGAARIEIKAPPPSNQDN